MNRVEELVQACSLRVGKWPRRLIPSSRINIHCPACSRAYMIVVCSSAAPKLFEKLWCFFFSPSPFFLGEYCAVTAAPRLSQYRSSRTVRVYAGEICRKEKHQRPSSVVSEVERLLFLFFSARCSECAVRWREGGGGENNVAMQKNHTRDCAWGRRAKTKQGSQAPVEK